MKNMDIRAWKKERDAAIKSYDIEKFKEFYEKWSNNGFYNIQLPPDSIIEISMRKSVIKMQSASDEEKAEARRWLAERGLHE